MNLYEGVGIAIETFGLSHATFEAASCQVAWLIVRRGDDVWAALLLEETRWLKSFASMILVSEAGKQQDDFGATCRALRSKHLEYAQLKRSLSEFPKRWTEARQNSFCLNLATALRHEGD